MAALPPTTPAAEPLALERPPRRSMATLAAALLLALVTWAAYANSFHGPFIFDDLGAISKNPNLWHFSSALSEKMPPEANTLVSRPLLRISFWLNYQLGGLDVRGYHALNLLLHILAAWTLLGLLKRLLEGPVLRERFGSVSLELALATSLLWALHPLQTESVSYIVQRAEVLGALFSLLSLAALLRASQTSAQGTRRLWLIACILFCLLGMASKETAAVVPLLALLLDRFYLNGSWKKLWARSRWFYGLLFSTWLFQGLLVSLSAKRMGTAGFGLGVSWWGYALTQPFYLCHYLAQACWPSFLVLDFGKYLASSAGEIVPYGMLILLLLALTFWALKRWPQAGCAALSFWLLLSPTSTVVPVVTQTGAEHRMYLPLAALLALLVVGSYGRLGRYVPSTKLRRLGGLGLVGALALVLGLLTWRRNLDYQSEFALWRDTVAKAPGNSRNHNNLGLALRAQGKLEEAMEAFRTAMRLDPESFSAHNNLGEVFQTQGHSDQAIEEYRQALRLNANSSEALNNLGNALQSLGRSDQAVAIYQRALRVAPYSAEVHYNLGIALQAQQKIDEAVAEYRKTLRLKPDYSEAHNNLGVALQAQGKLDEALRELREAVRLAPRSHENYNNLGNALQALGKIDQAKDSFRQALRYKPNSAEAHNNLGNIYLTQGKWIEANAELRESLRCKPDFAEAHNNLGNALQAQGNNPEAAEHYRQALKLNPNFSEAYFNLGIALYCLGRPQEAAEQYRQALRLNPNLALACYQLAWILATRDPAEGGNPAEALALAQRGCELTGQSESQYLDALAVAYASAGRFPEAIAAVQKAIQRARASGASSQIAPMQKRLELFQAGKPFRESPQPNP